MSPSIKKPSRCRASSWKAADKKVRSCPSSYPKTWNNDKILIIQLPMMCHQRSGVRLQPHREGTVWQEVKQIFLKQSDPWWIWEMVIGDITWDDSLSTAGDGATEDDGNDKKKNNKKTGECHKSPEITCACSQSRNLFVKAFSCTRPVLCGNDCDLSDHRWWFSTGTLCKGGSSRDSLNS